MADAALIRALDQSDIPAALDLISAQWPEIPRACQEQMIRQDPWRRRQRSFGAFVGGRLIAHARVHHRPIRLGQAELNMTGVCEVVTHPDHRRRGLGHAVLKAALEWLQGAGAHFVMLYTGVNPFYEKLGWGTIRQPRQCIRILEVPRLGSGRHPVSHVPIEANLSDLAAIYDQSCGRHPIGLVRTPEYWQSWPRWAKGNLWFGLLGDTWTVAWDEGRPVAYGGVQYSLASGKTMSVVEACCQPEHEDALWDVCDDLLERCRATACESVELNLPADHPLVARLASLGEESPDTSGMAKIVDLRGMFEALRPVLVARSAALPRPLRVRVESPVDRVTLAVEPGSVAFADCPEAAMARFTSAGLASLLLGFLPAAELAEAGDIRTEPDVLEVLDVLFPCLDSHYWQIDHF